MDKQSLMEAVCLFPDDERLPLPWSDKDGRIIASDGASLMASPPHQAEPSKALKASGEPSIVTFPIPDASGFIAMDAPNAAPRWVGLVRPWTIDRGIVLVDVSDGQMFLYGGAVSRPSSPLIDLHFLARVVEACDIMDTTVESIGHGGNADPVIFRAANGCVFAVMPVSP